MRRRHAQCRACGGPVIRWRALGIILRMCPQCDRLTCRSCGRVDLVGATWFCSCGSSLDNPNPIEGITTT